MKAKYQIRYNRARFEFDTLEKATETIEFLTRDEDMPYVVRLVELDEEGEFLRTLQTAY